MASLPTEIVTEEILPKVPTTSLVRFKCVSKYYNALISSPKFMDLHLRQYLSLDTNRLLIMTGWDKKNLSSVDLESPVSVTKIPFPDTLSSLAGVVSIVGTFNGLICIGPESGVGFTEIKHHIINPFTGISRDIPNQYIYTIPGEFRVSFGFGFDDVNNDYKLVRISENIVQSDVNLDDMLQSREVMVYSLKENSWKLIEDLDEPSDSMQGSQHGVLVQNHLLHWVFRGSNKYRICCVDVQSNKWANDVPLIDFIGHRLTDVDEDDKDKGVIDLVVGVLDGCLCASVVTKLYEAVWVMKEYGVKESWVKLFEISPSIVSDFKICGPFGFRRRSKRDVLIRFGDSEGPEGLHWCDIGSGTYGRTEEIKGIPLFEEACILERSFVSFPGSHKIQAS